MSTSFLSIFFFWTIFYQSTWAAPQCSDLFSRQGTAVEQAAQTLDDLNSKYDHFLFSESVYEKLNPETSELPFAGRMKARYQAFKLKRVLKVLKKPENLDQYELGLLSKKLVQLTFLTDPSVLQSMKYTERVLYQQAQQSILKKGLERFIFENEPASISTKRKIFNLVMTPFKEQYLRWMTAFMMMPKLHGVVMPFEVAEKIAWEGLDDNLELVRPYRVTAVGKSFFNIWSSTYNWSLVAALFIGVPTYGVYKWNQLSADGAEKMKPVLMEMLKTSEQMSDPGYAARQAENVALHEFMKTFEFEKGRVPNEQEISIMRLIVRQKLNLVEKN